MDQKQNKAKKASRQQQQAGMTKTQYETASEFGSQAQENAAAYEQARKQQELRQQKKQQN